MYELYVEELKSATSEHERKLLKIKISYINFEKLKSMSSH